MGSFLCVSLFQVLKDRESDWLHSLFSIVHMSYITYILLAACQSGAHLSQRQFPSHSEVRVYWKRGRDIVCPKHLVCLFCFNLLELNFLIGSSNFSWFTQICYSGALYLAQSQQHCSHLWAGWHFSKSLYWIPPRQAEISVWLWWGVNPWALASEVCTEVWWPLTLGHSLMTSFIEVLKYYP